MVLQSIYFYSCTLTFWIKGLSLMKIFVTGGSGYFGQQLIKRLITDQHQVSAVVESNEKAQIVQHLGATPIIGNLNNISNWQSAIAHHEIFVHAATPAKYWATQRFFDENVIRPTQLLYKMANKHQTKRFIYLSCESAVYHEKPLDGVDETFRFIPANSNYGAAKQEAERLLITSPSKTQCIILRPAFLWGPDVPSLKTIQQRVTQGKFMWVDHGNVMMETVHIDNLVEATCRSLTHGQNKNIYYVTDDHPRTVKEMIGLLLATRNITPTERSIPHNMAKIFASVFETIWKSLHIPSPPPFTRFEYSFASLSRRYNIGKIKTHMNYRSIVNFDQALKEMRDSHQEQV